MAYREVTMLEVKEVLRLWLGGVRKKRIAAQLGLDVKTVRRYITAAQATGLTLEAGPNGLDDDRLAAVVSTVQPGTGRPHGDGWADCVAQCAVIEGYLRQGVRLSKVRTLPRRRGVAVSYATLRRLAIAELGVGETAPTIPVADCGPGEEVQLDTGWMTLLAPDATGRRRRFRAWIFTAVLSRSLVNCQTESVYAAARDATAFRPGTGTGNGQKDGPRLEAAREGGEDASHFQRARQPRRALRANPDSGKIPAYRYIGLHAGASGDTGRGWA